MCRVPLVDHTRHVRMHLHMPMNMDMYLHMYMPLHLHMHVVHCDLFTTVVEYYH